MIGRTNAQRGIRLQTKLTSLLYGNAGTMLLPDEGYDGLEQVLISGDANCLPANIREGVTMFGVTGSYSGGGLPVPSRVTSEIITIEPNTVSNGAQALAYFGTGGVTKRIAFLLDSESVARQVHMMDVFSQSMKWNYTVGAELKQSNCMSAWTAYLVEGTRYLVLTYS